MAESNDSLEFLLRHGVFKEEALRWASLEGQAERSCSPSFEQLFNSILPVNTLPDEIFIAIVCFAASSNSASLSAVALRRITRLMGVCRHWRDSIIHTHLLWTDIDLSKNMQFAKLCVARSNPATFNWRMTETQVMPADWCPATCAFLEVHHTRIKHMQIHFQYQAFIGEKHWQLSIVPLPALVSMDLKISHRRSSLWIPTPEHLPSLQRLSLEDLTVDNILPLSQLTHLKLRRVDVIPKLSIASFLDMLQGCPLLQHFMYEHDTRKPEDVDGGLANSPNSPPADLKRTVSLPYMQHFDVYAFSFDIFCLLAHLSFPKQARLTLRPCGSDRDEYPNAPWLSTVLPRDTAYWPALGDITHVMVWWDIRDSLTAYGDVAHTEFWDSQPWMFPGFLLGVDDIPVAPSLYISDAIEDSIDSPLLSAIKELGDFFPPSVKTFVLRGGTQEIDTEVWARMLAAFPAIEHLELIAEEDAMPDFPAALEPTFSGDVPCPGLRELVLRYEPGDVSDHSRLLDALHTALQQRLAKGSRLAILNLEWECRNADDVGAFTGSVVSQVLPELLERTLALSRLVGSLRILVACQTLEVGDMWGWQLLNMSDNGSRYRSGSAGTAT